MAVGNTGEYLEFAADAMCTWLSRDGGATWEDVAPNAVRTALLLHSLCACQQLALASVAHLHKSLFNLAGCSCFPIVLTV